MQQPQQYQQPVPGPQLRTGIVFGPGRATRMPEQGTREYQEMINRMRGIYGQAQ